ncbi:MAG: beta-lactamase family protein [Candidatus Heimdallarchaeota archaeon]
MPNDINFEKFRKYANEQIDLFKNAGIAVSFVSSNEVLFEEGFGYRNVPEKLPFTTKTLFPLGSHTKSFTATAIAMLVDRDLLDWDTPIRNYIPKFRLESPYASEKVTIRDVLSHTTGLPHHQFTFMNTEWNYKEIFKRLPHLKPVFEFRTKHKYSNLNYYFIATKIIEELTGKNYFSFMKDKFLKPLGMKNTNFSVEISLKQMIIQKDIEKLMMDLLKNIIQIFNIFLQGRVVSILV